MFLAVSVQAVTVNWVIPNIEPATLFLDANNNELLTGWTSRFLATGDFEWRIGSANGIPVCGISYDIRNLEKLGAEVVYLWGDTSFIIGGYVGKNLSTGKLIYGANMILVQINLY